MSLSENIENQLLFVERKRLYDYPEINRIDLKFGDKEIINFGILCAKQSTRTNDWRFVNLALKILDSKLVSLDKTILKSEIEICINYLKKNIT